MPQMIPSDINEKFNAGVNHAWSFSESRSIDSFTHGYHRYPAKFIPQIVKKLIEDYTKPHDKIADVFAGCGTTLVESKIHGRKSVGVDINPVAELITQAKIHAIHPYTLLSGVKSLCSKMVHFNPEFSYAVNSHDRIDYWFRPEEKNKLAFLYNIILEFESEELKNFFLCALSNILKNCSRWLQRGTKPQIHLEKKIAPPFEAIAIQLKKMIKKNALFYQELARGNNLHVKCDIKLADAGIPKYGRIQLAL